MCKSMRICVCICLHIRMCTRTQRFWSPPHDHDGLYICTHAEVHLTSVRPSDGGVRLEAKAWSPFVQLLV